MTHRSQWVSDLEQMASGLNQRSSDGEVTHSCHHDFFFLAVLVVTWVPGRANSGLWLIWGC